VKKKNFVTAGVVVVSGFILAAAGGCSDDSTGSSSSASTCPAVGSKACPNDTPVSQTSYDACKKCETEGAAYAKCQGISSTPTCGADGKSEAQKIDLTKCKTELEAYGKCSQGGTSSSGGTDAGGGG
jgi:hypothetical protein